MSKGVKIIISASVAFVALITAFYIDSAVYPFQAANPNFSDVERYFNQLEVPKDWQQVRSSEYKGVKGRACPMFPRALCFHKSATYTPVGFSELDIRKLLDQYCTNGDPNYDEVIYPKNGKRSLNFRCELATDIVFSGTYRDGINELYMAISTE